MIDDWDDRSYRERLGDATSQWLNVALARGMPDESLSGRSYRNTVLKERDGLPVRWQWRVVRFLAEAIFYVRDRGRHTELAFWEDVVRSRKRGFAVDAIGLPPINGDLK